MGRDPRRGDRRHHCIRGRRNVAEQESALTDLTGIALLAVCIGASVSLRALGVIGAGRLRETSALFRWVGCVAFAIATGIMAKIIVAPSGALSEVSLDTRLGGVGIGLAVFFLTGRRVFVSLASGVAAFVVLAYVRG